MKKSIFAVMAFVVAAMLVGCNKDKENSEVAMTVSEITDSTAVIRCAYSPVKSVSYQLFAGRSGSEKCGESTKFTLANLCSGTRYDIVAITYDSENKQVGSSVVTFMTTGEPENKEQIRTDQQEDKDSVPPGHHPDLDDDDPYGGKYDPICIPGNGENNNEENND